MITTADFRIRRTGTVFYVWQQIGSGWQRLSDPHPTRAAAAAWIAAVVAPR